MFFSSVEGPECDSWSGQFRRQTLKSLTTHIVEFANVTKKFGITGERDRRQ